MFVNNLLKTCKPTMFHLKILLTTVLALSQLPYYVTPSRSESPLTMLHHSNGGTVLFGPNDLNRDCWNADQVALLTARLIIENVLPQLDEGAMRLRDDGFVVDLIEYLRMVLEVVRQMASGKAKHVLLMALSDAIGGYMKHLILPMAKYAYYAGNIEYANVVKLYQLYDEIKGFLRTNGEGWTKPLASIAQHIQARPIDLSANTKEVIPVDPCAGLVYIKRSSSDAKVRKRSGNGIGGESPKTCGLEIPMPFFDSKSHPSAIAVPFKSFTLRNLESRSSAYILVKYYIAAAKCHQAKHSDARSVEKFNSNLFSFIVRKVVPHMCDERFYAGFGGVLRIAESIKRSTENSVIGNFNLMPEVEDHEPEELDAASGCVGAAAGTGLVDGGGAEGGKGGAGAGDSSGGGGGGGGRAQGPAALAPGASAYDGADRGGGAAADGEVKRCGDESELELLQAIRSRSKSRLLLIAALATIIVWFCLGAIFIWCKMNKNRKNKGAFGDDKLKLLPCTTETCPENPANKVLSKLAPIIKKSSKSSGKPVTKTSSKTSGYSGEPCTNETCPGYQSGKSTEAEDEDTSNRGKTTSSKLTSGTATSVPESETDQKETIVQSIHYLPPNYACHTSMAGNMVGVGRTRAKSREASGDDSPEADGRRAAATRSTIAARVASPKKPYVFGYDFQTTSDEDDSTQGSTDGDNDLAGNMSK